MNWSRISELGRLSGLAAVVILFATALFAVTVDPAKAQGQTGPLIPAGSEVFEFLPVDQAKLSTEEKRFIASIGEIYADDEFFVAISEEFRKLEERYTAQNAPEREAIRLALMQIERFRSVFRGELAAISMPERRVIFPAKGWADGIESALRSYGYVFIDLNGKQFHSMAPPHVTQEQWKRCSRNPIRAGAWRGACKPSNKEILLHGLKAFE